MAFLGKGDAIAVNAVKVEPGVYSILHEGKSYTVVLDGDSAIVNGSRFPLPADPRDGAQETGAAGSTGPEQIRTLMPGRIVKVLAAVGDEVEPGAGILVVEAMKMQNELRATRGGRVTSIRTSEGATVGAGAVLATIE
jgi:biotin carboxyl carrier protein